MTFPADIDLWRLLGARCPEAVIVADRDGVIRHWNAAAERLFGHDATAAVGRTLDLIVPERLRARHWAGWDAVIRTGTSRYGDDLLEVPAQHADGRTLSIAFRVALLHDDAGDLAGIAAFLRDVTATFHELRDLRRQVAGRPRDRHELAGPLLSTDLGAALARLRDEPTWRTSSRNAVTLVKNGALRVVLVALHAGATMEPHSAPGPVTVQVVSGRLRFGAAGTDTVVTAGQLLALEPALLHDVTAVEESALLLTVVDVP